MCDFIMIIILKDVSDSDQHHFWFNILIITNIQRWSFVYTKHFWRYLILQEQIFIVNDMCLLPDEDLYLLIRHDKGKKIRAKRRRIWYYFFYPYPAIPEGLLTLLLLKLYKNKKKVFFAYSKLNCIYVPCNWKYHD